jgi:hypothetical protein
MHLLATLFCQKITPLREAYSHASTQTGYEPPADLLGQFGIESEKLTAAQSRVQTPGQEPIYLDIKKLGDRDFAVVKHALNVSTGVEYASIESLPETFRPELWKTEIEIMELISHLR